MIYSNAAQTDRQDGWCQDELTAGYTGMQNIQTGRTGAVMIHGQQDV
jgi:hypothetical protein